MLNDGVCVGVWVDDIDKLGVIVGVADILKDGVFDTLNEGVFVGV